MPELRNPRWEMFAKLTATGKDRASAYMGAGFAVCERRKASKKATRLLSQHPEIKARITEIEEMLHEQTLAATALTREYVIEQLTDNVDIAKAAKPVRDRDGKETGEFKADLGAANRALELLGKEQGMFRDRLDIHTLDGELENMSSSQLRAYVKSLATEVGLRVVEQTDDELRKFFIRNAERVGLRVIEAGREDPDGAEDAASGTVQAVSKTGRIPPLRH